MNFYVGLHQPANSKLFERAFVSINRIRTRKSTFAAREWIMDSGAFTEIAKHGRYRHEPEAYAADIDRWFRLSGTMVAAVSQDFMCEAHMLALTGGTIADHQRWTIERYDRIVAALTSEAYVMPVLQGYDPADYVSHLRQYGERLQPGAWVGVGSVCKRNGNPEAIEAVLSAIHDARPDLRLHGFGIKATALRSALVRQLLHSADSMAWSFHARMHGRNGNDPQEALGYIRRNNL